MRKWTTAELVERGRRFGAPVAPVHDIQGFLEDPQVAANRTVFDVEHPAAGRLRVVRHPVRFGASPASLRAHAPRLGEQGDEILREAGFAAEEIDRLRGAGGIG